MSRRAKISVHRPLEWVVFLFMWSPRAFSSESMSIKSEIRIPKSETNPNISKDPALGSTSFGFRISVFGFALPLALRLVQELPEPFGPELECVFRGSPTGELLPQPGRPLVFGGRDQLAGQRVEHKHLHAGRTRTGPRRDR